MKALVTGGAGFIGSHLAERLAKSGRAVRILDNFTSGKMSNLDWIHHYSDVEIMRGDCTNSGDIARALRGAEEVYHLAANPEVRLELSSPQECYRQNLFATFTLLEAARELSTKLIVFTSTSAVYGQASIKPTPETYGPLFPISIYGACKLASEALVASYCRTFAKSAVIVRLANVVGSRSTHGVIVDFINRLRNEPKELVVMGDGSQSKSYLDIDDCIDGIMLASHRVRDQLKIFNIASKDQINVKRIAKLVMEGLGLRDVKTKFKFGKNGRNGWNGDVEDMWLNIEKSAAIGFRPRWNSEQAVIRAVQILSQHSIPAVDNEGVALTADGSRGMTIEETQ